MPAPGATRGIGKRTAADGSRVYAVRWREPDGTRPRRSFDSLADALDFQARRRSAQRWRPEELRQERAGRRTLGAFFAQWWLDHAVVELKRSTLSVYRCLWEAHAEPRLSHLELAEIDARVVVRFRGELLAAGVGPTSVVKTMSLMQRVFRDAVEYGEVAFNPFKAVQKPSPGPTREARPLTPRQVEAVAHDIYRRGYDMSAVLVRLMAYTGLRPQEALGLQWGAVGQRTLLVEVANADGQLERLKNRKRSRKRSRSVDLMSAVRDDLADWRLASDPRSDAALIFPHITHGGLWLDEEYRTWRRRIYVPSAENVDLPSCRPYRRPRHEI